MTDAFSTTVVRSQKKACLLSGLNPLRDSAKPCAPNLLYISRQSPTKIVTAPNLRHQLGYKGAGPDKSIAFASGSSAGNC
jgi:hypothetical protein